jgi:hypothetical protein
VANPFLINKVSRQRDAGWTRMRWSVNGECGMMFFLVGMRQPMQSQAALTGQRGVAASPWQSRHFAS